MTKARAIMFQGTGSDVGKTVLTAGLCRLASRRGISVRPFKPQNMSNNAAVADVPLADGSGGEIGRAQWLQALACGVPSSVDMNPVLLKPQSDSGSQVIVCGEVFGQTTGSDYGSLKSELLPRVLDRFESLRSDCELVLVEGAGSPAETNLRSVDIANMGFASAADVPTILIGDISRGGVIASLVGTHTVLDESDRRLIRGFLVNKFRGDLSLFDEGKSKIESLTGWDCYGVIPWLGDIVSGLPAEDSLFFERSIGSESTSKRTSKRIVVPVFSRISNFDDLDPLRLESNVDVIFLGSSDRWRTDADLVILGGSKSTISDLLHFQKLGWDKELREHVARGGHVVGICGGYQMLGKTISDPTGIEGVSGEYEGLGLLDIETEILPKKIVRNRRAVDIGSGLELSGYEIHMGRTTGADALSRPMIMLDSEPDGAISSDGLVRGCYLHGLFGSDSWRRHYLDILGIESTLPNYRSHIESSLDCLADSLESHIDLSLLDLG